MVESNGRRVDEIGNGWLLSILNVRTQFLTAQWLRGYRGQANAHNRILKEAMFRKIALFGKCKKTCNGT